MFPSASRVLRAGLALATAGLVLSPSAAPAQPPALDTVLERARAAIGRYISEAALLLADERCDQKVYEGVYDTNPRGGGGVMLQPRGHRRWQAEMALVPTPDLASAGYPWTEFRDVVTVDGKPVPDRQERLSTILRQQNTVPIEQARAIALQSARFNLGRQRNINTPSMPLLVIDRANAHRFQFSAAGEERVQGITTLKVQFRELRSPTLVKNETQDCFSAGTAWIEPATGNIVQAEIRCGDESQATPPMTVRYQQEARLGLWVPSEMTERPDDGTVGTGVTYVDGRCRYSNYRRFETGAKLILK